jgi:hypothetical protein
MGEFPHGGRVRLDGIDYKIRSLGRNTDTKCGKYEIKRGRMTEEVVKQRYTFCEGTGITDIVMSKASNVEYHYTLKSLYGIFGPIQPGSCAESRR